VPDALRVPVSAVSPMPAGTRTSGGPGLPDDREATMAVFTLKDHRARLTSVEIGARNGVHAWVRSGLAPGDTVIAYPPSAIRDGARVRPRSDQPLAMAARRSL
jgi:HlyD family secretion protein